VFADILNTPISIDIEDIFGNVILAEFSEQIKLDSNFSLGCKALCLCLKAFLQNPKNNQKLFPNETARN
jgi:hypothetical protein